jgi:integrase/recombinase XerD
MAIGSHRKRTTLKQGERQFLKPVGNAADPDGLFAWMRRYLDHIKVRGYTEATVYGQERQLRDFIGWCDARGIERPHEVTKPIVEAYQRYLHYYRKRDGAPLSYISQRTKITPIKSFFRWLARENHVLYNPASDIELPRMTRRLPRHVLTAEEVDAVMRQPDTSDPYGVRDRAMMEVLYSTGIRRMELAQLKLTEVDLERGTLMVRDGKGRKDRFVPLGERAIDWVAQYIAEVRPQLVFARDDLTLFLTRTGESFNYCWLSRTVAQYIDKANIGKRGGCHIFRHTMATLMLENGADVRYIQAMLGHANLSTTSIYTQVAIRVLKEIHAATHPSGRRHTQADKPAVVDEAQQLSALLASLDAEGQDEAGDPAGDAIWH